MKRLALLLLLLACSKKTPSPAAVVDAAAPSEPSAPVPSVPACDLSVETATADLDVVSGSHVAGVKASLCRMEACRGAPPWVIEPKSLVTPVSGGRLAVLRIDVIGAESCEGGKGAVNRHVEEPSVKDDVIVYDEETTPLRAAEDGCEQAGPPTHRWHAVDTRTKEEWVVRGDVTFTVEAKAIVVKKAGCAEIRYSR